MRLILIISIFISVLYAKPIKLYKNHMANFTQIVTNTEKKVLKYNGKIYFFDNNQIKWEYTKPTKKEICINNNDIRIIDYDLEQVSYLILDKSFNFIKVLEAAKLYKKNIYISTYKNKKYTIKVDSKNNIQSIAYYDDLENKIQILFQNIKKLQSKKMLCEIPKNFDIIE